MTCYLRHMEEVFRGLGIEVEDSNRRSLDRALHRAAGVEYRDCIMAWKKIKKSLLEEESRELFLGKLKKELTEINGRK